MNEKQRTHYSTLFRYKHGLVRRSTEAELKFKEILDKYGIQYRLQKGIFTRDPFTKEKRFRIIDFYIPRCSVGIEIDGGHHFTKKGLMRDNYRLCELVLARKNLILWRFRNEEVMQESKELIRKIEILGEIQKLRLQNKVKLSGYRFILEANAVGVNNVIK